MDRPSKASTEHPHLGTPSKTVQGMLTDYPKEIGALRHVATWDAFPHAQHMTLAGPHILLSEPYGERTGVRILRRRGIDPPEDVGFYSLPNEFPLGIHVDGALAYIASQGFGLRVVDISDPAHPRKVSFFRKCFSCEHVAVHQGFAYVSGYPGIYVIDVRDPSNPKKIRGYRQTFQTRALVRSGSTIYATSHSYLVSYDIRDPQNLRKGYSILRGHLGVPNALAVDGTSLYVGYHKFSPKDIDGVEAIDLREETQPRSVALFSVGDTQSLAVDEEYLYVRDASHGIKLYSKPVFPAEL